MPFLIVSVPSCSSLRPQVSTPRRQNNSNTSLLASSTPHSSSVLNQSASKACLVNRFLRSITEKKISTRRSEAAFAAFNRKTSTKLNLYIYGVKPDDELSHELIHELEEEICNFSSESLSRLPQSGPQLEFETLKNFFHGHLGLSNKESVLKVSIFYLLCSSEESFLNYLSIFVFLSTVDFEDARHFYRCKWY